MQEGVTPRKRDRAAYMRSYRAATKAVERDGDGLLPFQGAYVRAVCRKEILRWRLRRCRSPGGMAKVGCAEGWLRGV